MKEEQMDDISFKSIEELRRILQTRLQLPESLFLKIEYLSTYIPKCASKWESLEDVIKEAEPYIKCDTFKIGYISFRSKRKEGDK